MKRTTITKQAIYIIFTLQLTTLMACSTSRVRQSEKQADWKTERNADRNVEMMGPTAPEPNEENSEEERNEPGESVGPPAPTQAEPWIIILGPSLGRSAAVIGVLAEIEKLKIPVSAVIASEMSAMWAALYSNSQNANAFLWNTQKIDLDMLKNLGTNLKSERTKNWSQLIRQKRINRTWESKLNSIFSDKMAESLRVPVYFGLKQLDSPEIRYVSQGKVKDLIRCTLAREGFLSPCEMENKQWIASDSDSPYPVEFAKDLAVQNGRGRVMVVDFLTDLESNAEIKAVYPGYLEMLDKKKNQLEKADQILAPSLNGIEIYDFSQRNQAEFRGKLEVDRVKLLLK